MRLISILVAAVMCLASSVATAQSLNIPKEVRIHAWEASRAAQRSIKPLRAAKRALTPPGHAGPDTACEQQPVFPWLEPQNSQFWCELSTQAIWTHHTNNDPPTATYHSILEVPCYRDCDQLFPLHDKCWGLCDAINTEYKGITAAVMYSYRAQYDNLMAVGENFSCEQLFGELLDIYEYHQSLMEMVCDDYDSTIWSLVGAGCYP